VDVSGGTRRLIAVALAVLVVAGMVVADVVTLHRAKPSFDQETQDLRKLPAVTTTTAPPPGRTTSFPMAAPVTAVTSSTLPAASRNSTTRSSTSTEASAPA
jgi:hypothetical protein